MRFTFGTYRYAVREPGFSVQQAGDPPHYPNTTMSLRSSVREYHLRGAKAAHDFLRKSLKAPYWRDGIGAGKAKVAHQLLDQYVAIDLADGRPPSHFDLKSEVDIGPDVVAVTVDLCLFGTSGFSGRLLLWDTRPCTRQQGLLLACPCAVGLEQELGPGSLEDIEVWLVRASTQYRYARKHALSGLGAVASLLRRVQS
jgi:hypothetical protein